MTSNKRCKNPLAQKKDNFPAGNRTGLMGAGRTMD